MMIRAKYLLKDLMDGVLEHRPKYSLHIYASWMIWRNPLDDFEKSYEELLAWLQMLHATTESSLPQIRSALDPTTTLPPNCPSHASKAELIFRQVTKRLSDVSAAVERVEDEIWKTERSV